MKELERFLEIVWDKEFKTRNEIITETGDALSPDKTFYPYNHNWGPIAMAFEQAGNRLHDLNVTLDEVGIYQTTQSGHITLNPSSTVDEFVKAQQRKILSPLRILCIGGPEGRVFADFGADVVNVDPYIAKAPATIQRPTLTELPDDFNRYTAKTITCNGVRLFDIALSCRVFDRGSGLDPLFRWIGSAVSYSETKIYKNMIMIILSCLKDGGVFIADGDMLHFALANAESKEIQVYATHRGDTPQDTSSVWAVKK